MKLQLSARSFRFHTDEGIITTMQHTERMHVIDIFIEVEHLILSIEGQNPSRIELTEELSFVTIKMYQEKITNAFDDAVKSTKEKDGVKFQKIDDDPDNYIFSNYRIKLLEGRDFDVFCVKDIYNFRVVGIYSTEKISAFNWTCTDEVNTLVTHRIAMRLIENGMPIDEFIHGSKIKPWILDADFRTWIKSKADKYGTTVQ